MVCKWKSIFYWHSSNIFLWGILCCLFETVIFPYHSNPFPPNVSKFLSVLSNEALQPLHLLTCWHYFIILQGWSCGSGCGGFGLRLQLHGTTGWLWHFIKLFDFVSSVEEFNEIMICSVALVFFPRFSEMLLERVG